MSEVKQGYTSTSIKKVSVSDLIPYANNSRLHSDEQVLQIASSIKEFGFLNPIIIDGDNGIIAGHGRVMAAKKLGIEELPCIDASHLTPAQKKAYVIADNKIALNSEWDVDALRVEFEALREMDFDIELTGFSLDEIGELEIEEIAPEYEEDADGEVIEPPPEPKSKEGDVWILGKHRLMCGDSTSIDAINKLLLDGRLDAIVTDPPYGIGIDGQKESKNKNPKHNRKAHDFMGWDSERPDSGVFNYIIASGVPSVIWGGNYFADLLPATRGWIYWSKGQDGLTMSDGELAWTTEGKPLRSVTVNRGALRGSVHPTQKPIQVIEFSLEYLKAGKIVLDLFGGSGTTLIACEKTERSARLMELEPKYCDVIINRWQTLTGKEATLESTGETFNSMVTV